MREDVELLEAVIKSPEDLKREELEHGIIVQGDQEFPVEIALAEGIPVFKCTECGMLHIGSEPGGFDPSEVDVDLDELMKREKTKTPKKRIGELLKFKNAAQVRDLLPKSKASAPVA